MTTKNKKSDKKLTSKKELNVKEASELSGKSKHTIKHLIINGKIPFKKVKGKYGQENRIKTDDLIKYYDLDIKKEEEKESIKESLNETKKSTDNTPDNSPDNTSDNYAGNTDNTKIINILEKQLDRKDDQIKTLQELLKNEQILNTQNQALLLQYKEQEKPEPVQKEVEIQKAEITEIKKTEPKNNKKTSKKAKSKKSIPKTNIEKPEKKKGIFSRWFRRDK